MSTQINLQVPKKPIIRKLGTIKCDVVEITPVLFHDRLYRLEYFRGRVRNRQNKTDDTWLHFIDVYTNESMGFFAKNHHFGTAFVDGDYMYVAAIIDNTTLSWQNGQRWGANTVEIFRSKDLKEWVLHGELMIPGHNLFNTGICKKDGVYTMLIETAQPKIFTFCFAQSTDLKNWTLLSEDHMFQKGRYAGGPAIYTLPDDPYFYVTYLEENPGPNYTNCIARSTDLINWEYSLVNPVLMFDAYEDKKIASPFLTETERADIDRALDINNSDMELCEFLGRTIIYYSWGDQKGTEFLAEACFEGSMKEFLQGFFA